MDKTKLSAASEEDTEYRRKFTMNNGNNFVPFVILCILIYLAIVGLFVWDLYAGIIAFGLVTFFGIYIVYNEMKLNITDKPAAKKGNVNAK
jgi:predicted neutral ceramidase superfamily lipid hydrolase